MLKTLANTAIIGGAISMFRRATGHNDTNYFAAVGLFAAGILVGGGAALMLAPKSGKELRADVKSRARQLGSAASERFDRVKSAAIENTSLESH